MATDMITGLITSFGEPILESLGAKVGLPRDVVKKFAPVVIGLVIAAIARKAKQPGGMSEVEGMINTASQQAGGASLQDFINSVDPTKSGDMLKSLAGANDLENVVSNLSGKTGIPAEAVTGLLGSVAPAVLSQLGAAQKAQGLDIQGLMTAVGDSLGSLEDAGTIDYLLDNTPGISDDIKRAFNKLFGS